MELIKKLLFGDSEETRNITVPTYTIVLEERPSFEEWCQEFRVSTLYDKKAIHFD